MSLSTAEKDEIALQFIAAGKYSVLPDGRVFSKNYQGWTGQRAQLMPKATKKGYLTVVLRVGGNKIQFYVHRLVLLAFRGRPMGAKTQANHTNGVKADNRLENLEWSTPSENLAHARATGLNNPSRGEVHYRAKLTELQVLEIKRLLRDGNLSKRAIERMYGVGRGVVTAIASGKSWKHVQSFEVTDD